MLKPQLKPNNGEAFRHLMFPSNTDPSDTSNTPIHTEHQQASNRALRRTNIKQKLPKFSL